MTEDGYDRERVTPADPVDVIAYLGTCPGHGCAYVDVVQLMRGDHSRARAVLRDLEVSGLIRWENNGRVWLGKGTGR